MELFKRKYSELIALYKLEEGLKDVYVEGNTDKSFFEMYLKSRKCDKKVVAIELIDLSNIEVEYFEGLSPLSNRNKVIVLSKLLQEKVPSSSVQCIVDKDFDDHITCITNSKLIRTDFSCLESYIFSEEVLNKFLSVGLTNFPFGASFVYGELSKVLVSLFGIRLLRELNYPGLQLLDTSKNLNINKSAGTINLDVVDYLTKLVNKNAIKDRPDVVLGHYSQLLTKMVGDVRHYIHGHDFSEVFFLYVNCIKNTQKYKLEHFEKVLLLTVEAGMIDQFPLFQALLS